MLHKASSDIPVTELHKSLYFSEFNSYIWTTLLPSPISVYKLIRAKGEVKLA